MDFVIKLGIRKKKRIFGIFIKLGFKEDLRLEGSEDLIHSTPRSNRFAHSIIWFEGVLLSSYEEFSLSSFLVVLQHVIW